MATPEPWWASVSMSPLLGAARLAYVEAVRRDLAAAGLDDVPPRGPFVLGAVAHHGATLGDALGGLHLGPERDRRLHLALVGGGFLHAGAGADDALEEGILTERGLAVAAVTRSAIASVDAELAGRVGEDAVATLRACLGELVEIAHTRRGEPFHG